MKQNYQHIHYYLTTQVEAVVNISTSEHVYTNINFRRSLYIEKGLKSNFAALLVVHLIDEKRCATRGVLSPTYITYCNLRRWVKYKCFQYHPCEPANKKTDTAIVIKNCSLNRQKIVK